MDLNNQETVNYIQQIKNQYCINKNNLKNLEINRKKYESIIPKLGMYRDRISINIMVPIPSLEAPLAFIEGTAIHSNELLVPLGTKYFVKMSTHDTILYCNRRKEEFATTEKGLLNEQKLLAERLSFINFQKSPSDIEIIEELNENEEKSWGEKHAASVRKMKMQEAEERKKINEISADSYFARLEQLAQEELEMEED